MSDAVVAPSGQPATITDGARDVAPTVEALLFGLIAVIALALRLYRPDWMPLDPLESGVAVPAWQSVNGLNSAASGSPLLHQLVRLAFWLVDGGEEIARFVPAIAGAATVAFMYRLRGAVGHGAALGVAMLLALSPLWVFLGRSVAPDSIAALAIVLLLGGAVSRFPMDAYLVPIAGAMALAAGGPAHSFIAAALLFAIVRYAQGGRTKLDDDIALLWPTPAGRTTAAVAFAATLVLASTGLLTQPTGLASLVQNAGRWFAELSAAPFADPWAFVMSLGVYSPVALVAGIAGTYLAATRGNAFGRLIVLWVLVGVVVGLVGGAPMFVGATLLPLTMAAGMALGRLAEATADAFRWQEDGVMVGILLIVVAYAAVQLLTFSKADDAGIGSSSWMLALGAMGLVVVLILAYALLWGRNVAGRVAAWTVVIVLGMLALANGFNLNYMSSAELREPMRTRYTAPGAHALAESLADVSWQTTRDPNALKTSADPVLRSDLAWPLRQRDVDWAPVGGVVTAPSVVVPSGLVIDAGDSVFRGQTHLVGGSWNISFASTHDFVKWLMHRRRPVGATDIETIGADLYVQVAEPQIEPQADSQNGLQEGDG